MVMAPRHPPKNAQKPPAPPAPPPKKPSTLLGLPIIYVDVCENCQKKLSKIKFGDLK